MKTKLKKKLAILLLMLAGIGCAMVHAAAESNEVARTMSKVATDNGRQGGASRQDTMEVRGSDWIESGQIWEHLQKYSFDYPGLRAAVQKLQGREETFEDVPVVGKSEIAQDGSIVVKLGHPGKDWNHSNPYWHPWMRVRFGKEAVDLVDIDMWDRLTSVKVRFTGTVEELGADCVGIAYVLPPPKDPLAGKDAATITGDELPKMVRDHGFGQRQYAVLQQKLAGRRLLFRASSIEWDSIDQSARLFSVEILARSSGSGGVVVTDDGTIIHMCPVIRRPFYVLVRCADDGMIDRLVYLRSDPGLCVAEMSATVADPVSVKRKDRHPDHPILVLEDPKIRLNHEPEQFPDIDPRTVTGDELTRLFARRKSRVPDRIVKQLGAALVGHDLTFDKLEVLQTSQPSSDWTETIFCKTTNPSKCGIPIMVKVSLDRLNALPRTPCAGDSLLCVSGRVSQVVHHGDCGFTQSWILLNVFSIEKLRGKSESLLDTWMEFLGLR